VVNEEARRAVEALLAVYQSARSAREEGLSGMDADLAYQLRVKAGGQATAALAWAVGAENGHPVSAAIHARLGRAFALGSDTTNAWRQAQNIRGWLISPGFDEAVERWTELAKLPAEYAGELMVRVGP
jgi:hypothetical protein